MTFDLFEYMDDDEDREQIGLITEVSVQSGWFVFASAPNEERFYPFSSKSEAEEQKIAINQAIDENGWVNAKGKRSSALKAVCLTVYGEGSVLNKDATWEKVDNYMVNFSKAYREVFIKLSLPNWYEGKSPGDRVWAKVNYAQDPDRPTREMPDGTERANLVPYIVSVYEDREDAAEAALVLMQGMDNYVPVPPKPEGYKYDNWAQFYRDMVNDFANGKEKATFAGLADFGVPEEIVDQAYDEAMAKSEKIPF
jgi:hypothetical protein